MGQKPGHLTTENIKMANKHMKNAPHHMSKEKYKLK